MARTVIRTHGVSLTEAEKQIIRDVREFANTTQKDVRRDMGIIWSTRRRRRLRKIASFPKIQRWIGNQTKHRKIRRINRRIRKLSKWLDNRRIIIVVRPGTHRFFCSTPGRKGYSRGPRFISPVIRFQINKNTFFDPGQTIETQAALMVHELCHEMGMSHFRNDNDEYREILANALTSSRERVTKNPYISDVSLS